MVAIERPATLQRRLNPYDNLNPMMRRREAIERRISLRACRIVIEESSDIAYGSSHVALLSRSLEKPVYPYSYLFTRFLF
ncbi:MAG: hypothetical protein J0H89_10825 [Rhizobiales bacterium]|nr:hypothetical protein [Hyphomicrobiales bacterium]